MSRPGAMQRRVQLGYALSSEEHPPLDLVAYAKQAEDTGFEFALISDHYHPWTSRQGQSSFVWSVLGALATNTSRLQIGTGVTCPSVRTHPAVVAQASATVATLMPGRRGEHYTVENATLYTRPDEPPPFMVAASGEQAAELAGRTGDGFISTAPVASLVDTFAKAQSAAGRGGDAPRYGQLTVCWAADEAAARKIALEWWPNSALHGELSVELPVPAHYEQATVDVTEDMIARSIICGPDPERHLEGIEEFADAGFDHVYVHQVGPDQEGFMRFYDEHVLPHYR